MEGTQFPPVVTIAANLSELSALHVDVQSLQQPDGSFAGDAWGEIDTRLVTAMLLCNVFTLIRN